MLQTKATLMQKSLYKETNLQESSDGGYELAGSADLCNWNILKMKKKLIYCQRARYVCEKTCKDL